MIDRAAETETSSAARRSTDRPASDRDTPPTTTHSHAHTHATHTVRREGGGAGTKIRARVRVRVPTSWCLASVRWWCRVGLSWLLPGVVHSGADDRGASSFRSHLQRLHHVPAAARPGRHRRQGGRLEGGVAQVRLGHPALGAILVSELPTQPLSTGPTTRTVQLTAMRVPISACLLGTTPSRARTTPTLTARSARRFVPSSTRR